MAIYTRPWNNTSPGDAGPYSAEQWHDIYAAFSNRLANDGVLRWYLGGLAVSQSSPSSTSVRVASGAAVVQGVFVLVDSTATVTHTANVAGNPRYDIVTLEVDYAAQTADIVIVQGTAAASPVDPPLTQTVGGVYQIPLARVLCVNGFTNILNADITDYREYGGEATMLRQLSHNNVGGVIPPGFAMRYGTNVFNVVKGQFGDDTNWAGVSAGASASGDDIMTVREGQFKIYTNSISITGNDKLVPSTTDGEFVIDNDAIKYYATARPQGTVSGPGYIDAWVGERYNRGKLYTAFLGSDISTTSTSYNATGLSVTGTKKHTNTYLVVVAMLRVQLNANFTNIKMRLYDVSAATGYTPEVNVPVENAAPIIQTVCPMWFIDGKAANSAINLRIEYGSSSGGSAVTIKAFSRITVFETYMI